MHTTHLRKVGGSVMLAVPPVLLETLQIQPGTQVGIAVEQGRLVVEPRQRARYSLDELIKESKNAKRRSKADREWTGGKPTGRELI
jgi:antitoxin ChpS